MQQHAVPQQISSYEFKLVGDMTLKQFFQVGGGIVIAFFVFISPLPAIIRWPISLFSALLGTGLAFFPVEGRPLSIWILSFFKAVYSPTYYSFQKGAAEDVFAKNGTPAPILAPEGEEKAKEYLSSIPQPKIVSSFEEQEKNFFENVNTLFQNTPPATPQKSSQPAARGSFMPSPFQIVEEGENQEPPTQEKQRLNIPQNMPVQIQQRQEPIQIETPTQNITKGVVTPVLTPRPAPSFQQTANTSKAIFSVEAAPPNPTTIVNTIVGQVLGKNGEIIENAILEVREKNGSPVRALKTNKVGHFMTVTPLKNGVYEIITEKDGYQFDIVNFQADGKIIPPILIKSKN